MNHHDLLVALCGRDARPALQHPWSVTIDGVQYACATDGMRILYVADEEPPFPTATDTKFSEILRGFARDQHSYEFHRAPLLSAIGDGAVAAWGDDVCQRCGGLGEVEPSPGTDHLCPDCDGFGKLGGRIYCPRPQPIWIEIWPNSVCLDAQLLQGVLARLPGDPIRVATDFGGAACFFGAGWALAIAALDYRWAPDALAAQLVPLRATVAPTAEEHQQ